MPRNNLRKIAKGSEAEAAPSASADRGPASRVAGMVAFAQARKLDSRERLLNAAAAIFGERDYWSASIDDVASAAGVSRITFYRHFTNKTALAIALFQCAAQEALPRYLAIRDHDFNDRAVVVEWLETLFAADRDNRSLLRAFIQANVEGNGFTQSAQSLIGEIIAGFGRSIPAFKARPDQPAERRHWLQAWLLVYEILDQSNHAAMGAAIAGEMLLIDILADRFMTFVNQLA